MSLHRLPVVGPINSICSSENGVVCPREHQLSREQAVEDDFRIGYLSSYGDQIALKIAEGVPVKSYLMWAWTDNFECKRLCRWTMSDRS